MDLRIVARHLGIVVVLIGLSMLLSVPWGLPALGEVQSVEWSGVGALLGSLLVSLMLGVGLLAVGRSGEGRMLRKEALAIVGLSWVTASVLGALPLLLSGSCGEVHHVDAIVNAVFESASGFTGTGATIYGDLEDPERLPRCILFWRQETHFLGGLGIMVLFVAILGHGVPGKLLMQTEATGPIRQNVHSRTQHAARAFAFIYLAMNAVLIGLYLVQGMGLYDAIGHAFATVATGGFSTYNASLAHFDHTGIEVTTVLFMVLACTNFMLLFAVVCGHPADLFRDPECRAYLGVIVAATLLVMLIGLRNGDFSGTGEALRYSLFQVVSIQTNTGLATADFDRWDDAARVLLLGLMFVGGCAGSTSCSIKVIRYVLLAKILRDEVERSYRPQLVRTLRYGGQRVDQESVIRGVPFYFGLFALICAIGWLALMATEPDSLWDARGGGSAKGLDCASAVAACINGVGPGLGVVGPTRNFDILTNAGKLVLALLMLLGRLELFAILCLFSPRFWRWN